MTKKRLLEHFAEGGLAIGDGSFVFTMEKRGYVKARSWTPETGTGYYRNKSFKMSVLPWIFILFSLGIAPEASACISMSNSPSRDIHTIVNLRQLNDAIKNGTNRKIGFLSSANYESVRGYLDELAEPVIYGDTDEITNAVVQEEILAGLVSGLPDDGVCYSLFNVFPSHVISPRAFQMKRGNDSWDLLRAVDAAIVRTQSQGQLLQAVNNNPPFEATFIQNCHTGDMDLLPFPSASEATGLLKNVLDEKVLKILAFGTPNNKPDWGEDGNYEVDPPTGFWPDYVQFFMEQFQSQYGDDIKLERVWMVGDEGTNMVLNGSIHMTEPYYIYENVAFKKPKKWQFEFSCIVMGYEQTYFTVKHV